MFIALFLIIIITEPLLKQGHSPLILFQNKSISTTTEYGVNSVKTDLIVLSSPKCGIFLLCDEELKLNHECGPLQFTTAQLCSKHD